MKTAPHTDQAFRSLIQRRRSLIQQVPQLEEEEIAHRDAETNDWIDRAVAVESEAVVRTLAESERAELSEIDAALDRIAHGRFGVCEACGGRIPARRLRAVPEARTCLACRAKQEAQRS